MWRVASILLLIHCAFGVPKLETRIDPLVETTLGLIRGVRSENGQYSSFLGIPYALVDEENPFAPSVAHPGFENAFNAYDGSNICPQVDEQEDAHGQIQCLNLNIYVPSSATSQNRLPVMVYIHGGAFTKGSGTSGIGTPTYLIEKDVIVVTINYRLGIYGFLCTDSPRAPGNIGLKDQLLALRWINQHIASFGGNNGKITIMGESAGGISVHLHLLSHFEPLFNNAIIESGPATSPWGLVDINNSVPLRLAEVLGFVTEDVDAALDFIASADVKLAVAASNQIRSTSQYNDVPLTKPCIEKEFDGIERFVTVNPNVAKSEKAKTVPIIIGFASQEMVFKHAGRNGQFYNDYSIENLLSFGFDVTDFDNMVDLVRHFYIGDEAPSETLQNKITSLASDFIYNHPTERAVALLLKSDAQAVYHYVFSYQDGKMELEIQNSSLTGASHAAEIKYLFNLIFEPNEISDDDKLMIEKMTTLWTNFAKYGDPTPETSDLLPVKWEAVSQDSIPYLNIDKDLSLEFRPFHDRMAFWDLFYKLNEAKTEWYTEEF